MTLGTYHVFITFWLLAGWILMSKAKLGFDAENGEQIMQYDRSLSAEERPPLVNSREIEKKVQQEKGKNHYYWSRVYGKRGEDTFKGSFWARGFGKRSDNHMQRLNVIYCIITRCSTMYPRTLKTQNDVDDRLKVEDMYPQGKYAMPVDSEED